jgi:hypothetical protein
MGHHDKDCGTATGRKLYEELLNDTSKQSRPTTIKLWLPKIQDEYETLHTDIEELIGIANFMKMTI